MEGRAGWWEGGRWAGSITSTGWGRGSRKIWNKGYWLGVIAPNTAVEAYSNRCHTPFEEHLTAKGMEF